MFWLGDAYGRGGLVAVDWDKSISYMRSAAAAGLPRRPWWPWAGGISIARAW